MVGDSGKGISYLNVHVVVEKLIKYRVLWIKIFDIFKNDDNNYNTHTRRPIIEFHSKIYK